MYLSVASHSRAADVETLIMPGPVVQGHADIESECSNCHKLFEKAAQTNLCLDCHEDIQLDVRQKIGFHGLSDEVNGADCASCHAEHLGRRADIVPLVEQIFDHTLTDFMLVQSHIDVACADCHSSDQKYRDAPGDCNGCHAGDDVHRGELGESCDDCHNENVWTEVTFDHSQTDYPLLGKHEPVACIDCHIDELYDGTPVDCFSCHEDDDSHFGLSGDDCGNCHSPSGWDDSKFDHQRDTIFALEHGHANLECEDCHSDEPFSDRLEVACIGCHEEDDDHDGHYGPDCENCHSVIEWETATFDHDLDTDYPLTGAHTDTGCIDCHVEPLYDVALKIECNSCHAEDDPHDGTQGTDCESCHNDASWTEHVLFDHDLTRFPLLGKHIDEECDACHETKVFNDVKTACVDCHDDDDPHEYRFTTACEDCHNPVDWQIWFFDHNLRTDFVLDGAHVSVACNDCHRQPVESMFKLAARCGECHRSDDVHDGEFGADCGRCHSAESFQEVRTLQ